MLCSPAFAQLRQAADWKALIGRLVPLTADLAQPVDRMGPSRSEWRKLQKEVQVVLHCARSSSTDRRTAHTNGSSGRVLFEALAVRGAASCFVNCVCALAPTLLAPLPVAVRQQLNQAQQKDPLGGIAHELLVTAQVQCVDLALQVHCCS